MTRRPPAWTVLLLWAPLGAPAAPGYIGAKACGECHAPEFSAQSRSAHAQSLYPASQHPLANKLMTAGPLWRGKYRFVFIRGDGGPRYRADDAKYATELPVEWAFGAGIHAVTLLSKVAPDFYLELAFTYYSDTAKFDLTPRHESLPAGTLHDAMGQPIKTRTAGLQCFGCHSTGHASISETGELSPGQNGVRCEACHGAGEAHRDAVLKGNASQAKRLIKNPGVLGAAALNQFCGQCHRVAANMADVDWNSPWSYRHQPPYLERSRCFRSSGGKLSCLTCHDPHQPMPRAAPGFYRSRCAACHARAHKQDADCTGCHMPVVRASSHLGFHNHQIGIYK